MFMLNLAIFLELPKKAKVKVKVASVDIGILRGISLEKSH
jgi:hypothetical protein